MKIFYLYYCREVGALKEKKLISFTISLDIKTPQIPSCIYSKQKSSVTEREY